MRIAAILLLSMLTGGCTSHEWIPSRPHPTPDKIRELAKITDWVEPPPEPLKLKTSPVLPVSYSALRVTCILPSKADGGYNFRIEGVYAAAGTTNTREITYVFRIGCDPVRVSCEYREYRSPYGYMKPQVRELLLDPSGECK
jgi:hypothetical protein